MGTKTLAMAALAAIITTGAAHAQFYQPYQWRPIPNATPVFPTYTPPPSPMITRPFFAQPVPPPAPPQQVIIMPGSGPTHY